MINNTEDTIFSAVAADGTVVFTDLMVVDGQLVTDEGYQAGTPEGDKWLVEEQLCELRAQEGHTWCELTMAHKKMGA
jgi:hypothetical protein